MKSFKLETKEEKTKRQKNSIWGWKISDEEIKNQVDNYDKLTITKSVRGNALIAGLVLTIISSIVIFLGLAGDEDAGYAFLGVIIYAIFLIFIYRGHRWAMVAFMIMYTIDLSYNLYNAYAYGNGSIWPIIWWFIIIPFFWKALKVENERKRIAVKNASKDTEKMFCKKCGASLETDSKFCIKCGNKTI